MSLDQNENVVYTDGEDEEWYDFNNNERCGKANETEQANGTNNGSQYDEYAAKAEGDFRIDLKLKSTREH